MTTPAPAEWTAERLNRNFHLLVAAAVAGERCPQSHPHGPIETGAMQRLWDKGMVRSEVFKHNYRVVTIMVGQHKGKTTLRPPGLGAPYAINGRHV
jgi:hypothetical protein